MVRKDEDIVCKIRNKVKDVVIKNRLINNNEKFILAVSGGPDSMCLFDIFNFLKEKLKHEFNINFSFCVAHVNHMIREESKKEKIYVENMCNKLNIPFYYREVDVPNISKKLHMSEETCGRKLRYDFLYEIKNKINADKIVIAHNMDDNVETIILNIIRGCGLKGLTGMNYEYKSIIRPLLDIEKKEILEYNIMQDLKPCFDKTNELDIYARNKIRLNLIPILKNEYNSNIMESIIRMKHILELDEDFLNNYTEKIVNNSIIDNNNNIVKFDFSIILNEHESIKRRCIRKIVEIKVGSIDGVENIHILDILNLLTNNITRKKYILGNKFTIEIVKKNIAIIY